MLKLLIIDDDQSVCQSIQEMINWNVIGIEVIGETSNGLDAYDIICKTRPDIVITDIKIPGISGLELIKRVNELNLSTNFIIISHYRNFDYLYSALKYNVTYYLLKPIKKSELLAALEKICFIQSMNINITDDNLYIKKILADNRRQLHCRFISNMISELKSNPNIVLEEINHKFQIKFVNGNYQAFVIRLDSKTNAESGKNIEIMLTRISQHVEMSLKNICAEVIACIHNMTIICILNYSDNLVNTTDYYHQLFDEIKKFSDIDGFNLTAGVGRSEQNFLKIPESISDAQHAIQCRITLGIDRIIEFDKLHFDYKLIFEVLTSIMELQLVNAIEILDKKILQCKLREIFNNIQSKPNVNPCLIFDVCKEMSSKFILIMKKNGISPESYDFETEVNDILERAFDVKELHNNLYLWAEKYIDLCLQQKESVDCKPIRLAKLFISEHYMEPLTLEVVAALINLNPDYFSVIFKKETGVKYSTYLINCRISGAKHLLKFTNLSMDQVSKKVGYFDKKHFSKLFYKIVGVNPSEYRKLYS